jgi:hypothetical protein
VTSEVSRPAGVTPMLRVVRGDPTPEEIAALSTVLVVRAAAAAGTQPPPRAAAGWADRASLLRRPLFAGPGAWHASALRR